MIHRASFVILTVAIALELCSADSFFERLQQLQQSVAPPKKSDDLIKVVHGKVKRFEQLTVPLLTYNPVRPIYYNNFQSMWQASANLVSDGPDSTVAGVISFQQWPSNNFIKLNVNVTGLSVGKHALHIHEFGDVSQGCKSTGGHFPNNFIGNVDTNEEGSISSAFLSSYLTLFGFHGIIGRSIVIHSKPIDINNSLNAEVFSSSLQAIPDAVAFQNEENSVGPAIACGIISITASNIGDGVNMMPPPPPPPTL